MKGEIRAAAKLITALENETPWAYQVYRSLFNQQKTGLVVGITGAPGSGKSTLIEKMIGNYRQQGRKVGVLAVDPSSPFSGGAILGDRVRMQRYANDPGVFIRSMATRGQTGGLSIAAGSAIRVMKALGMEVVIVETVGVGQDEVDIIKVADVSVVLLAPGQGDDIQSIKAGVMEIADIFAINKSDLPGADQVAVELAEINEVQDRRPVIKTSAILNKGIDLLIASIQNDAQRPKKDELWRLQEEFKQILRYKLNKKTEQWLSRKEIEKEVHRQLASKIDPFTLSEQVMEHLFAAQWVVEEEG